MAASLFACGDDGGGGTASASASSTGGTTSTGTATTGNGTGTSDTTPTTSGGSVSDSMGTTTTTGSPTTSSASSSTSEGVSSTTTTDPGTTTNSTPGTTTTDTTSDTSDTTGTTGTTGTTTDGETTGTTGGPNCDEMGGGGDAISLIWIANSAENTVSKIDTKTGVELGRYRTRPANGGSPSRTSVNRYGDVAVANRTGGVTKVYSRVERCVDSNNDGVITTSTGGNNVLPWGQDECVAWHLPLNHGDNRPVAWTGGVFNENSCEWEDLNVWTAWSDVQPGTAVVALLDGDDGSVIQQVPIPDLPQPWPGWYGFYGAAVDSDNNVWLSQLQGSNPQKSWLVRVNHDDFTYDHWDVNAEGGYGMTVTSEGYVWICGRTLRRFNPMTQQWTELPQLNGDVHTGGCMGDGQGVLYRGAYNKIIGINTTTLEVVKTLNVGQQGDDYIWGVAVDFDGRVWGVPRNGSRAYKVNPDTGVIEILFQGLVGAYTYSDMTGFALFNVIPA